jgi:uncharacterized phage protein (TIGR01671 family)
MHHAIRIGICICSGYRTFWGNGMNREMKFRAWDKEYKFMYQNAYPFEHLVYVEMHDDDETFQQFKHKMQVVNGKYFYWIIAKDVEVMQFTGLQDKNGKGIWEGDILQETFMGEILEWSRWIVGFEVGASGVYRPADAGEEEPFFQTFCDSFQDVSGRFSVIGNIYEHPHLLEVGHERNGHYY